MQNFKISVPTVAYYIAGTCFPSIFSVDTELLRAVENEVREFLFTPAAIAEKEGGIIGKYRICSELFPVVNIYERRGGKLVAEIDASAKSYLCIYLPERKEAGERAFLFSDNKEDFKILKELAFPFAGD